MNDTASVGERVTRGGDSRMALAFRVVRTGEIAEMAAPDFIEVAFTPIRRIEPNP